MASTLVKNDIHLIFHIKTTSKEMLEKDLSRIFAYIGGIISKAGGIPMGIGGRPDHVHILTSLPKTISMAEFVRLIKSNSSKWIKTLGNYYDEFSWQDGYGAFSVSPYLTDKTVLYINGQKEHHQKRSFQEEYKMFLDAYGIKYDDRFVCSN
ncbi:MAG: transposase [Bacteroidales bacterium]|nr:transposase [Bacteroidales bacterium]